MDADFPIVIIGAGASGLAAAILLARRGLDVTVVDKLSDLSQSDEESYPIGVNPRGLRVLEMVDPALRHAIEVAGVIEGWSIRKPDSEIARLPSGTVVGSTRGRVVAALHAKAVEAAERDGYALALRLSWRLRAVSADARTLTFARSGGGGTPPTAAPSADDAAGGDGGDEEEWVLDTARSRVIDASGCWSKLRDALAAADPSFVVERFPWRVFYRNLYTPAEPTAPTTMAASAAPLDPKLHYIFTSAGIYVAVLKERRWVLSLSASADKPEDAYLLSDAATPDAIARLKAHVAAHAPPAAAMLDDAEYERYFSRRAFTGQVVRLSRLHDAERRIAFMGDAAHAVLPATGEGVNSALEDVGVLLAALDFGEGDGEGGEGEGEGKGQRARGWFARYDAARRDDARAISEYAAWLLAGQQADAAEKNRRTANLIVTAILQKTGAIGETWNDKSFGKFAGRCEPYAQILREWKEQQAWVRPIANAIVLIPNMLAARRADERGAAATAKTAIAATPTPSTTTTTASGAATGTAPGVGVGK